MSKWIWDCPSFGNKSLSTGLRMFIIGIMLLPSAGEAQWVRTSLPGNGVSVDHLAVLGAKLFAGTGNNGLLYSTDDGSTWESPDTSLLDTGDVSCLSFMGTRLYTQVEQFDNFITSADTGRSWTISDITFPDDWFGLISYETKWFTMVSNSIWVSNDSGSSWNGFGSYFYSKQLDIYSLAFNDTETFVGTSNGIYLSTDRGQTWQLTNPNLQIFNVTSLCIVDSTILAATRFDGLYRADLSHLSWAKSDSGLTNPYTVQMIRLRNGLALTSYNTYPYTSNVFFSTDDGLTWKDFSIPLGATGISCMVASDSELYVGTYAGTVYKRPLSDLLTEVSSASPDRPSTFSLAQNYPNPFNPTTVITYDIAKRSHISLIVYDVLGRQVATLVNAERQPGQYQVTFNGSDLPSGVYFYRLQAGNYTATKRLVLVK